MTDNGAHQVFVQNDGAKIAYEVLGSRHIGDAEPLVLVGGLSSLRGDWERLALCLAEERPVLIFDHRYPLELSRALELYAQVFQLIRGIGDSTLSGKEIITIELMARDLLSLLVFLGWKIIAICGFSMGGLITQQLLFLPYLAVDPVLLPFTVTHVLLTGSLTGPLRDKRYDLKLAKIPPGRKLSREEKRELARPMLESSFDPKWVADPSNTARLNWWLDRMIYGRPARTILMQARAINAVCFDNYYPKLHRDIQVLIIHGILDEVVPFTCAQEIMDRIPWATMVEVGPNPGQVESLDFGHHWFEYYNIGIWHDVITNFLNNHTAGASPLARL